MVLEGEGGRSIRIQVKPSILLKSPITRIPGEVTLFFYPADYHSNARNKKSSCVHRDKTLRLVSEEYQIRRRRDFKQLSRKRLLAEEVQGEKEHAEIVLLMRAADKGLSYTELDPQDALLLARAARDVVSAESRSADLRVKECELLLETLKDAAEQARTTWSEANDQVGTILAFFSHRGIRVDLPYPRLVPPVCHTLGFDSFPSLSSDTSSDESSSDA